MNIGKAIDLAVKALVTLMETPGTHYVDKAAAEDMAKVMGVFTGERWHVKESHDKKKREVQYRVVREDVG